MLAVLGPNGAGKSTAISLWLGLLEPDAGEVRLMGGSPLEVASRLEVGVMMQDVNLAPDLKVREHIAQTASYYAKPLSVDESLKVSGTTPLAEKRYGKLSGGQKRQVQFAVAICGRPKLLFLDEPTVGLDIEAREALWRAIRKLMADGCSIVLTTHYLEEAEALADRVAVLAKGKLIATGSVEEMRSLVTRRRISCRSGVDIDEIRGWPGVVEVTRDENPGEKNQLQVTAFDAEGVVRRLLVADPGLSHLEVRQASLAEAFTELTKEAA
jgi:ABC-type multidrug transport system ATPase subunit